jgi:hypothetical protein
MDAWGKLDSCELSYTLQQASGGPGVAVSTVPAPLRGSLASLDLVFCIDVTGSMAGDIDSVKTAATNIVDTIAAKYDDYRVAIIAYRDWDDSARFLMFEDHVFSTEKGNDHLQYQQPQCWRR